MPFPPSIKPAPDSERFLKVLRRDGEPDRVPFYELFADLGTMEAVLEKPFGEGDHYRDCYLEYQVRMGYDYIPAPLDGFTFPRRPRHTVGDTAGGGQRGFETEDNPTLSNRVEFEQYPWPDPFKFPSETLEYYAAHVPEGMTVVGHVPGGVLENVMWLTTYSGLSFMLYDDRDLARSIFDQVGEILLTICERYASMDFVGAIVMGDDMGHKTGTMFSPEDLREFVFPWQKKIVAAAHRMNKPFILHTCGNLKMVMEDLIETCEIDAKHSFEDEIEPVTEAKKKYGDRIAILGGADVHFLCNATEDEVRKYTRRVLEECMPGGGYALGTGNSVANYIPVNNFIAMLDEGWQAGRY